MADSNDLLRRIARVGADIDPGLSDRDVERLVEGARRRRRRRTVTRVGAGTGGVETETVEKSIAAGATMTPAEQRAPPDTCSSPSRPAVHAADACAWRRAIVVPSGNTWPTPST